MAGIQERCHETASQPPEQSEGFLEQHQQHADAYLLHALANTPVAQEQNHHMLNSSPLMWSGHRSIASSPSSASQKNPSHAPQQQQQQQLEYYQMMLAQQHAGMPYPQHASGGYLNTAIGMPPLHGSTMVHPGQGMPPLAKTCVHCSRSKVKCDRVQPVCGRCHRLKLECAPQLRRRGRPMKLNQSLLQAAPGGLGETMHATDAAQADAVAAMLLLPSRESPTSAPSLRNASTPWGTALTPQLLQALQLTECHPATYAESVISRFVDLFKGGEVIGPKASAVLTSWQLWNIQQGRDCTDGALSSLAMLLAVTLPELNDVESAYPSSMAGEGALREFLDSTPPEAGAAFCGVVWRRGQLEIRCNERFNAMYLSRDELQEAMRERLARPEHIWMRLLSAESRHPFAQDHASMLFQVSTTGAKAWRPLLVIDRFGLELLSVVMQRHFISPCGWFSASQLFILPVSHKDTNLLVNCHRPPCSCNPHSSDEWATSWLSGPTFSSSGQSPVPGALASTSSAPSPAPSTANSLDPLPSSSPVTLMCTQTM